MTEAFRFVGVGLLTTVGSASLIAAALALRNERRTIKLAEVRMGHFRAEQIRLLESLREERRSLKEELEQAREQRLEAEREVERLAERLRRESLLSRQEQERLAEALEQERAKRLEAEQRERSTYREAERRIDRSERELREAQREARRESSPLVAKVSSGEAPGSSGLAREESPSVPVARETTRTSRPASFPETTTPVPATPERAEGSREDKKRSRRAVWMPHPDDGAEGGRAPRSPGQARGDAPTEMFRKHYDKYLENYKGYLELAEGLYRARDEGEVPSGSLPKGEWEERVRRVNDGIQRTTARLDILEGHYPELVTDARISRRASLAKKHSEFKRAMRGRETS